MSIDINVHITADSNLVNAISDVATCLAVISAAQSGNTAVWLPEKTVTAPEPPAEVPAKAETKKDTKAKEKPLQGEPVSAKKAKEIEDLTKEPEPAKKEAPAPAEPAPAPVKEEPKTADDEAAKCEKLKELFTKAAVEGKAAQPSARPCLPSLT